MNFLQTLLGPFSYLYAGITTVRNKLYDSGVLSSVSFPVPVITVGNLTVGGTGKTPHVEYLVRLLKGKQIAILSRGYKRQTQGFILADQTATAATIGDEPYQYFREFPEVTVAVCADRVQGINQILLEKPLTQVILLDDAFQHRPVRAHLNILITDYNRLFYQDSVLPAGRLRESRAGASRSDVVLVSKCPEELDLAERENIRRQISKYCRSGTPVYFTGYQYCEPVSFGSKSAAGKEILLITGIAQSGPLLNYLQRAGYIIKKHYNFPDHYAYSQQDVREISNFADSFPDGQISVVTTRKDWTKLVSPELKEQVQRLPIFYLPITVQFLADQEKFDKHILTVALTN